MLRFNSEEINVILVTGGAGYIGSHTVINLLENGYKVVIFDNLEVGHIETVETLKKISNNVEFIKGDLKNFDDINSVFKKYKIDAVLHFAAYALVSESVEKPEKYYENNVKGSFNLFNAMVENNVKKIVFSSTCAVFGEPEYTPIDENHSKKPVNPYGETKLKVEDILKDFDTKYDLKFVALRYFNVAGADSKSRTGEWHNIETHLIPNILKSALNNSGEFKIFGNDYDTKDGTCIRDYVNVEDLARAHILALKFLENNNKSDDFNIGTGSGDSVFDVFYAVQEVIAKGIKFEICQKREGDPAKLFADNKKATEILGWKPHNTLKDSIKTAYEWEKMLQSKI